MGVDLLSVFPDGRVCISILHAPGDDPMGYELSAERWSPVQSVEKILLSVVSMLAGKSRAIHIGPHRHNGIDNFPFQNQTMSPVQMWMQQSCGVINVNNSIKLRKVLYEKLLVYHHKNTIFPKQKLVRTRKRKSLKMYKMCKEKLYFSNKKRS